MLGGRARRAEHGHRRPDLGERVEAAGELGGDVADALGVGRAHLGGLVAEPQQQLLVEGLRGARHGSPCGRFVRSGRCPRARQAYGPLARRPAGAPSRRRGRPPGRVPSVARWPSRPRARDPLHRPPLRARAAGARERARRTAGVEVVLPARAPERAAAAAVSELRPWIERRLARGARGAASARRARRHACPTSAARCSSCPQAGRTRVHRHGERLLVPAGDARPALERFYRRAARAEIAPRLDRASALAGQHLQRPGHPRAAHPLGVVLGRAGA